MRLRGDIDIHAKRHRRLHPACRGDLADGLDLLRAFGIDLADAGIKGGADLVRRLADTGKDDPPCRNPGGQRARHLAARDDVGPGPVLCQKGDDTKRGIGLQREMHGAAGRPDGIGETAVIITDSVTGIDIKRAAMACHDPGKRHAGGTEMALCVTGE